MVRITYAQMANVKSVLDIWWNVKGLPWAFLVKLDEVAAVITTHHDTFEKLRQKFINDYVEKDADGKAKLNGNIPVFTDKAVADAEWEKLLAVEFDSPALTADDLSAHAEALGLTPGVLRSIKPIIV